MFENLTRRVRSDTLCTLNNLPEITCVASLAHHGLLGSVFLLRLHDVDLTSVPADHLVSLVSSVKAKGAVLIENVNGRGLVTILDNVKSESLIIERQNLSRKETKAIMRAIESGVKKLELWDGVTLDIRVLKEYNGQGKCGIVRCEGDTLDRYRKQLNMNWARSRNWKLDYIDEDGGRKLYR